MDKVTQNYFAGVETGGTNIKCIIASDPTHVVSELILPTLDPETTIHKVIEFFITGEKRYGIPITSMGIAAFGPLDLNPSSLSYGSITSTPKLSWQNYPLLDTMRRAFSYPIAIDTDVNAALLGETLWGAGIGFTDVVYVTVGTGIGGGILSNGKLVHGLIHPELGHMLIHHDLQSDPFKGNCPFHNDCLEGLASGASMAARWRINPEKLPDDHPAWEVEADYLAQMCINLTLVFSPQRIIIGGGVPQHEGLLERIRSKYQQLLNGYLVSPFYSEKIEGYIVPPMLGHRAGILGAIALARTLH
jgi:fructokinase